MTNASCRVLIFCFLAIMMLSSASPVVAGTTGALIGYVFTGDGRPVSQAFVSAASPSQSASTITDATGHFIFASLRPDAYSVSVSKEGYRTALQSDVELAADNTQTLEFVLEREVRTLSKVVVSEAAGLLKPGTTQSVYTISAPLQKTLSALGGGTNLDQAYSGISGVPGSFVPPFQTGWNQPIFLRAGDFDEIGYELDGIPLNRVFDNIPTTNLSTIGQQQLQVYTGGAPANAESHGLAGYVNQVIKTGTVPGFASATVSFGSPAFYNKFAIEGGGETADRRLSYYFAAGGFDQDYRYADQFNGAPLSRQFGQPFDLANAAFGPLSTLPGAGVGCTTFIPNGSNFAGCYANHAYFGSLPVGPGGYILGPYSVGKNSSTTDRENVVNFHYAIPHARAGVDDDIQLLYDVSQLYTFLYSSYADWGGAGTWTNAEALSPGLHAPGSVPIFISGFQYTGVLGQPAFPGATGNIVGMIPYLYPSEGAFGLNGQIPVNRRDASSNGQALVKVQYQHDFGSGEYVRVYGYSAYSNSFTHDPNFANQFYQPNGAVVTANDRELWTHTHGFAATYAAQLNPAHLFSVTASYLSSNNVFFDNNQTTNSTPGPPFFPPAQSAFAALVNTANPLNGTCYFIDESNPASTPTATSCEPTTPVPFPPASNTKFLTFSGPFVPPPSGFEWLALEQGPTGVTNSVTPKFTSFSIEDQWRPKNRVHVNYGVRVDRFQYDLSSTSGGAIRQFWVHEWNTVMCANSGVNGGNPIDETLPSSLGGPGLPPGTPCALLGPGWHSAAISGSSPSSFAHNVFEPRIGGTYVADVDDVFRLSYGAYATPPQAQYVQYDTLQQNLANFIGSQFYALGYTSPAHDLRPAVSYNYDFSWEHRFHRTDASFKLTPFYRDTRDKEQAFFISPTQLSGVNAGKQTAYGAEFLLASGNPQKDGFSALLSYTYTYSRIKYGSLPNGSTLLSPVVSAIQLYNSFTSACASAVPSTSPTALCGVFGSSNAVKTESASGVANPYYNAPAQPLLDPNGSYPTYHVVPTGTQLSSASYGIPHNATVAVTYHHQRWNVTPLFQFIAGSRYGAPEQQIGVDPRTCAPLSGAVASDPRYKYGGTGSPYDATTCVSTIVIPDQVTGKFDAPGAFLEPSYVGMHAQLSYDLSSRATAQLIAANIIASCFGGSIEPWTLGNHQCGYDVISGRIPPVGNIYNPGDSIQRLVRYPYGNLFTSQPLNMYFSVDFKL